MYQRSIACRAGFAAAVMLVMLPAVASAKEKVNLRPKFPEGRKQYIETKTTFAQQAEGLPGGMGIDAKTLVGVIEEVLESSGDGVNLKLTFDRQSVDVTLPNPIGGKSQRHRYDSDFPGREASPLLGDAAKSLLGSSLTMEFDKNLHLLKATGVDELTRRLQAGAGQIGGNANALFDGQQIASLYGESRFWLLPDRDVSKGMTWRSNHEINFPGVGSLALNADCKLKRIKKSGKRKLAIIEYTTTMNSKGGVGAKNPMGMSLSFEGGSGSGTIHFDLKEGQIVKQQETSKITMKMSMDVGGRGMPGGGVMPEIAMKMNTSVETKVVSMDKRLAERKKHDKQADKEDKKSKKKSKKPKGKKKGKAKEGDSKRDR